MPVKKHTYRFGRQPVNYYFNTGLARLGEICTRSTTILLTDEHVFKAHRKLFKGWDTIVLKPGEAYKVQQTVDAVVDQLIEMGADRNTTLVGVGGGVVTDLTGYIASVYMRGIRFGFYPSSLLAMVDAAIGGKNGIDVGVYKNMVGTIRQPSFIAFDTRLLASLPKKEWCNGFAEVIKHACIKDAALFLELESRSLKYYQSTPTALQELVRRNALIKTRVVQRDEFEQGERRLLNFGHTLGHALENSYELSHGQAVAIGMTYAAALSAELLGFTGMDRMVAVLNQYGLPAFAQFDRRKAIAVLQKDKKKVRDTLNYILLKKIGRGVVYPLPVRELETLLAQVLR